MIELPKALRGGYLVYSGSSLEEECIQVQINIFDRLTLYASKRKPNMNVTLNGKHFMFGRTYKPDLDRIALIEEPGSKKEIQIEVYKLESGCFFQYSAPERMTKPIRIKDMTINEGRDHFLYQKSQEPALARKIEIFLYQFGLTELEALNIKPRLLEGIGLERAEELSVQQLTLEEIFKMTLDYEKLITSKSKKRRHERKPIYPNLIS